MPNTPELSEAAFAVHASKLSPDDAAGKWVQLVPVGVFKARDGRGPFRVEGERHMLAIVALTKQIAGSTELVVDYDHQSVFGAKPGVGGTAKAAGWLKEFDVRSDGIWGRVEWTEAAANAIRAGEYRYISPFFLHHKTTGKVFAFKSAGLTNVPALDLAEVTASSLNFKPSDEGEPMDKILAALGLDKGSDENAIVASINSLQSGVADIAKACGLKDDVKPADIVSAVNSTFSDRRKVAETAGLKPEASTDDIVNALQSAMSSSSPDPAKFVPIEQVTQLQNDVKALQESVVGGKAEEAVNSAIKDGKLAPSLKQWGMDLAKKDLGQFQTFVGSAPVLTAPQLKETKREKGDGEVSLDDAQMATCSMLGLDPKDYAETLKSETEEAV